MAHSTISPPKNKEEWLWWLDNDMRFAQVCLVEHGHIKPMFVFHLPSGDKLVLECEIVDADHRHSVLAYLRIVATALDVVALSTIYEAWALDVTKEPDESPAATFKRAVDEGILPSQSERRIEVIGVHLAYRDGAGERQSLARFGEIIRGPDGASSAIKDDGPIGEEHGGAFGDLMSRQPPTRERRSLAMGVVTRMGDDIMKQLQIRQLGMQQR